MITRLRSIPLSRWIFLAMLAGIFVGWQFPEGAKRLGFISTIFLHLIKCIIVPLIFSTLVVGIAGHTDDIKAVGRLALKSILYFEIVTTLALFIGLAAVNLAQPGRGVQLNAPASTGKEFAATKVTVDSVVGHLAPQSFFDAAARNDVLQVVVFAILFGVALARVKGKAKHTMLD